MGYRRKTIEVSVGKVGVGGENPIRIQSMTNTKTSDVEATVCQIMSLADCGCEIVRVTVQGMKEAWACEGIKDTLLSRGYDVPLVADIHFFPQAAVCVSDFVDKVRINPGNYVDKRARFISEEYSDKDYEIELEKIEEALYPLLDKCKRMNKPIRIGVNHGSLSDRIMTRYGDSPRGMVESAIEFTRIFRKYDFHNIIYSMKSSNPTIMTEAYRNLVRVLDSNNWNYPLHLGVTEAGFGEYGRIKSAIGISSLLVDGIGDTIRVSLTEDPCNEIGPCKSIIKALPKNLSENVISENRRYLLENISVVKEKMGKPSSKFILPISANNEEDINFLKKIIFDKSKKDLSIPDVIYLTDLKDSKLTIEDFLCYGIRIEVDPVIVRDDQSSWNVIDDAKEGFCLIDFDKSDILSYVESVSKFIVYVSSLKHRKDLILCFKIDNYKDSIFDIATLCGFFLCEQLISGVCFLTKDDVYKRKNTTLSFLQASGLRNFRTEFISCPGCGRTLFDIEKITQIIQDKTGHLPGVKIAVMGCIVNGPGEMADADFGYVGSKTGLVDLYVGKLCIEKNIPEDIACDKLIHLIKAKGKWIDLEE